MLASDIAIIDIKEHQINYSMDELIPQIYQLASAGISAGIHASLYSLDYRKQVLKSLDEGMTFAEAAVFYDISPTTIQKWKKRLHSKTTRDIKPYKIEDEALAQDVKDHPDDYHYERAQRFRCSPIGISKAFR